MGSSGSRVVLPKHISTQQRCRRFTSSALRFANQMNIKWLLTVVWVCFSPVTTGLFIKLFWCGSGCMPGERCPSELCSLTRVAVFLITSHAVLCDVPGTTLAHFPVGLFLLYLLNTSYLCVNLKLLLFLLFSFF